MKAPNISRDLPPSPPLGGEGRGEGDTPKPLALTPTLSRKRERERDPFDSCFPTP